MIELVVLGALAALAALAGGAGEARAIAGTIVAAERERGQGARA